MQEFGERPEGDAGRILIETLKTMTLATMAALSGRDERKRRAVTLVVV